MAEFQDQAAGNLVLRLTRLRQRTATGGPVGPASLTAGRLSACSSAADVNTGGAGTIPYVQIRRISVRSYGAETLLPERVRMPVRRPPRYPAILISDAGPPLRAPTMGLQRPGSLRFRRSRTVATCEKDPVAREGEADAAVCAARSFRSWC